MNIRKHHVVKAMNDFIFERGYAVKITTGREQYKRLPNILFEILSSGAIVEISALNEFEAEITVNGTCISEFTDEELDKLLTTKVPGHVGEAILQKHMLFNVSPATKMQDAIGAWALSELEKNAKSAELVDEVLKNKIDPDKAICESGAFGRRKIGFDKEEKKYYREQIDALVDALVDAYISYPSAARLFALNNLINQALKKDSEKVRVEEKAERHNDGKLEWSLVDFKALEPMVRVLMKGSQKYSPDNWKKGLTTRSILDSLMRHYTDISSGEDNDPETGEPHIGHLMCNAMFYSWMVANKPELDNR